MPNNLKPCPFCGGEASMHWAESGIYYWVECDICRVSCSGEKTKELATEEWNRRTPDIVHCHECKYARTTKQGQLFCTVYDNYSKEEAEFCSDGEGKKHD